MQSDGEGDVYKGAGFYLPRSLCPLIGSRRFRGLQGSFSIKDIIRLALCRVLPGSYRLTSKVLVETL